MHVEYKQDAEQADVVHLTTKQRKTEGYAMHVEYLADFVCWMTKQRTSGAYDARRMLLLVLLLLLHTIGPLARYIQND